jgi:cell division protein FtsL
MPSVAQAPRVARPRGRLQRGTGAKSKPKPKPRLLGGGVLWIVLFAALLAGVVAVNVAVLGLNVELDEIGRERSQLRADIAGIRAQLSSSAATAQIERVAEEELGLVLADPEATTFVPLQPR